MFKRCAVEVLENDLVGKWSTVCEDLANDIKEAIDKSGLDFTSYEIYSDGNFFGVWMEDEEGEEAEIIIEVEKAGSTWYITKVR